MPDINGVAVKFPFEPYSIQLDYMRNVIDSLENKRHALLESPTGTGKTLCLLCATMGWIAKQKEIKRKWISKLTEESDDDDDEMQNGLAATAAANKENGVSNGSNKMHGDSNELSINTDEEIPMDNIPQVFYALRTHSQITQVMKELKNSPYKDTMAAVCASRAQLCINPNVKNSSNAMYKCLNLTKNNNCQYKNNLQSKMKQPEYEKPILDIEDLCKSGEVFDCCPYYASKELQKKAEITFLPYNYLLDPKIRDICSIDLKNSIVIFDEAHNVEKACEQNACASIKTSDLADANKELNLVLRILRETESDEENNEKLEFNCENVEKLQLSIQAIEGLISSTIPTNENLYDGGYLFSLFKKAEITSENYKGYADLMSDLIKFLCNESESEDAKGLKKTSEFLRVAFSSSADELKNKVNQCCKVQLKNNFDGIHSKTLNFWCFSPALGMKPLFEREIRCLIMTSGTLEPLDELKTEMEIPSPIMLRNPHIIDRSQVFVNIVRCGKDEIVFNSRLKNRDNVGYLKSLGEFIVELCDYIPDGILIFFASYDVMNLCIQFWRNNNIWSQMKTKRPIYCERKNKPAADLETTMQNYIESINKNKGAIFMAVLRGKLSEGMDFPDNYGRATIIVGIPFAPWSDKKTQSKMAFMDGRNSTDKNVQSGSDWYCLDAMRAVNQAIGRVIRHKNDYGAILLCDIRFNDMNKKRYLSTWVKENPDIEKNYDFHTMTKQLKGFFSRCEKTLPKPKSKLQAESVRLQLSDDEDDDSNDTNGNKVYDEYLEDENSDDQNFIDDDSIDDQYSDSSSDSSCSESSGTESEEEEPVKKPKKSNKRKKPPPKKRSTNKRKQSYVSPNKKPKKEASPSVTESSEDENTEDEKFIDDGDSTDDDDFIDDDHVNNQYSSSSSFEGIKTRSNRKRPITRSTTLAKRKKQPTKTRSRRLKSPQPSTSYKRAGRTNNDESGNDSDVPKRKIKRAQNGKIYKRIIVDSDSESESESTNANPILTCLRRSLNKIQYNQVVVAFNKYEKGSITYESYRDTLFELFDDEADTENLMGMLWFMKSEHCSKFHSDVQKKFAK